MELQRGDVKIAWVDLGEGWHGDYNPDDPEDDELLRFDIYKATKHGWEALDDGSYCTRTPTSTPEDVQLRLLVYLLDALYTPVMQGEYKRRAEEMSWIEASWANL